MLIMLMIWRKWFLYVVMLQQPTVVKIGLCLIAAYLGMQLPYLFLKNRIGKRQLSIKRAFPDALDLLVVQPQIGIRVYRTRRRGARKFELARVRYDLYYEVQGNSLLVLALWQTSRRPPKL